MYYLIFILFVFLLFSHKLIFSLIVISFLIFLLIIKHEKAFIFLFIFSALVVFANYKKNINYNYINYNEKFINALFLISDFSEKRGDKYIVSAFPFEIVYEREINLYRGQIVNIAGNIIKNKIYAKEIEIKKEGILLLKFFSEIRNNLLAHIEKIENENFRSLVKSFIFGDRYALDYETKENFRLTGLMHLLALSGLHIAIIAGFVNIVLSFFFRKTTVFWLTSVFVVLYIFLSGLSPSVLRAGFMFVVLNYYYLKGLNPEIFDVMMFTAFISVVVFPEFLFNIGFWLSYAAFGGIFFFSTFFDFFFQKVPSFLQKSFSITLSANLATLPLMLYYFGSVSLISFLSNLIVIPLFSIFLIFLFCNYLCSFINFNFFYFIVEFLWKIIQSITGIFSYFPIYLKFDNFKIYHLGFMYFFMVGLIFASELIFCYKLKRIEKI
ncbi:MAG: ComEC/Rec2 family competence protein [Brevinematales bacterium]|nr:ComEC/Rec2 family competence protein [Brevinematales bacterium]